MNIPPHGRRPTEAEMASAARLGWHCDVRNCYNPVTIVIWRWFTRKDGRRAESERFLCSPHGEASARRYRAEIEDAPPGLGWPLTRA